MRTLASSLLSFALLALPSATLRAQQAADSITVGRWVGRADITTTWTTRRTLDLQLDVQPDGMVSGTIGDAVLADARISRGNRLAHAIGRGRDYTIDGRLSGAIIRAEGVQRERVHISIDCVNYRITGDLQTSGEYKGPISGRLLTARVTLERAGANVASRDSAPRRTPARGAGVSRSDCT